jgi:hypothetical protein
MLFGSVACALTHICTHYLIYRFTKKDERAKIRIIRFVSLSKLWRVRDPFAKISGLGTT